MMAWLNETFMLGIGKGAILQEEELMIRFINVGKDSRCPKGMKCVWEGDAEVSLEVKISGKEIISTILHTNQRFHQEQKFERYTIRLISLMPHPMKGEEIHPEDYTVTLCIQKSGIKALINQ